MSTMTTTAVGLTREAAERRIAALRARRNAVRTDLARLLAERKRMFDMEPMRQNHAAGKAARDELGRLAVELEMLIGQVVGDVADAPTAPVRLDVRAETAADLRTRRQTEIQARVREVLRAAGGSMSCNDIASLVGVSPHGLGGLIEGDPRIEKYHSGRVRNTEAWYRLVPGDG